jgi:hypothetical protein
MQFASAFSCFKFNECKQHKAMFISMLVLWEKGFKLIFVFSKSAVVERFIDVYTSCQSLNNYNNY